MKRRKGYRFTYADGRTRDGYCPVWASAMRRIYGARVTESRVFIYSDRHVCWEGC